MKGLTVSLRVVVIFVVALIVAAALITVSNNFIGGKLSNIMNEVFGGGLMMLPIYNLRGEKK